MLLVDYNKVIEFLSFLRVRVDSEPGDLNLLCLQAANPVPKEKAPLGAFIEPNANETNIYNDVIIMANKDKFNNKHITLALGTVDPGTAFKDHPGGQAHLTFGQHLYVPGKHAGYPALRGLNELNRVWRDVDKNFELTESDYVSVGCFGVNIHAGGSSKYINNWSAGCINVFGGWESKEYLKLIELAKEHMRNRGSIGVTVWSAKDFFAFDSQSWSYRPTLRFGMANPWVGELQSLLGVKKKFQGTVDSDWGPKTTAAVKEFQLENGLKVDRVVGQATWAKLLQP